ncbi:uncharacterized protein LOC122034510 [Zingiber officinale]|uniref:uncharacterized protein LOC122034510 n=1 Tax=Zingiber officinale TaxID=94328 RepID=UPI001C4D2C98|nr:uncharacterized protein LOC122034510 [Zingiber officinale]
MASLVIFIFQLMHVCWMLDKIETGDEDDEEESKASYSEINGDLVLSKITEMRLVPSDAGKYFDCLLIKSSQRDHSFHLCDLQDLEIVQEHRKTEHADSDEICLVDVTTVYPVSHRQLDCPTCSPLGAKEDWHKELANGQNKFNNKEHTYSLISELLPLLKHIYQNQLNEMEVKQGDQEGGFSGVLLRVYEPHNELVNWYVFTSVTPLRIS